MTLSCPAPALNSLCTLCLCVREGKVYVRHSLHSQKDLWAIGSVHQVDSTLYRHSADLVTLNCRKAQSNCWG